MGCTTTTLKFAVITLNILCAIFGALMLAASAYGISEFPDSELVQVPCVIGIVLGSLLFLTIIPGCCGPLGERVRSIWIYSTCLLILMLAQIVVNIVFAVDFDALAAETMNKTWQLQFSGNNSTMLDYEANYLCCGKNGPDDYTLSGLAIPPQCYRNQNSANELDLYITGCETVLRMQFENSAKIEVISDWTLVGVEALTSILAGMLAINLTNVQRRKPFH